MRNFSKTFSISAILVLSMMLVFALASCGGGDTTPSETNTNTDSNQTEENINLTVTFRQGGGYADVIRNVKKGAGVTDIPTPQPVLGYNVSWENVDLSNVQDDMIVNVVKTPIEYEIKYVLNGGINNASNPKSYNVENYNFNLYEPTKIGKATFLGWYTTETFQPETKITQIKECYYKNITLYAYWLECQVESAEGFEIDTSALVPKLSKDIPNSVENIDLNQAITVSKGCTWKLYRDFQGYDELKLKAMTLNIGENKAYIIVYHPDGEHWLRYELVLYRLDILDYTFYDGTQVVKTGKIEEKSPIVAPEYNPNKIGYDFVGWTMNGLSASFPFMATKDATSLYNQIVFNAAYSNSVYNVNYDLGGGVNNELNPSTYTYGSESLLYSPTRDYYTFDGWYNDPYFSDAPITHISAQDYGNKTLYAKWVPTQYSIEYVLNGGINNPENPATYNVETAVTFSDPTRDGYTFDGWYSDSGFTTKVTGISVGTTGAKTFYAKWIPNNNTLVFDANGGIGTMSNMAIATDATAKLDSNKFTKVGYAFIGWSTTKSGSVEYTDGASYTMGTDSSYTLYAVWQANNNTLVFDANGGTGTMSNMTIATDATATLTKNNFTRTGYTFIGWSTTKSASVEYTDGASYKMGTDSSYTLYAVWELTTYTITYYKDGGTEITTNPTKFTIEDLPITINDLEKETVLFEGWYLTSDFSGNIVTQITEPKNITLYAKYLRGVEALTFEENNGEWTVTDCDTSVTAVDIPSVYKQKKVTAIGSSAFSGCSSLTSVTIPDSVTSIGSSAFAYCSKLTSVNYLGTVEEWCNISFGNYNANPLYYAEKLYINGELVTNVVIPSTVTEIKDYAFYCYSSLTNVTIPSSVTSIGDVAFYNCYSLTSVNYLGTAKEWCNISFGGPSANPLYYAEKLYINGELVTDLVIPSTVTEIKDDAFYCYSNLTSVTIGNGVTSIGNYAFYDCSNLTSVTIGNGVTSIGSSAFAYCNNLTSVTIPSSVTSIGSSAFENCSSLTIYCEAASQPSGWNSNWNCTNCPVKWGHNNITTNSTFDYVLHDNKAYLTNYKGTSTEITIPATIDGYSVVSFGGIFGYNTTITSITSITIPDSVTSIGSSAFENCSSLTSVTIGNGVTSIGAEAFSGCSSLTSVTIPSSVKSIGDAAFRYCDSLTSITIPSSVTSIGSYAFKDCYSLTSVNYLGTVEEWCNISFDDLDANPLYYAKKLYINGELVTDLVIPSTVTEIKDYAFSGCSNLTSITIGNGVTSIGSYAFYYCSNLTSITIGNGVTSIGSSAFYNCSSLTSIEIPNSVTSIGSYAFYCCSKLTSVTIGNGVTSIGTYAFYGCNNLTSVNYLGTIEEWCNISFGDASANPLYYAEKLYINGELVTDLVIPSTVTEIKNYAFRGCDSLTSVTIGNGVTSIGSYAFYSCSSLTSVTIPDSVTSIGGSAFSDCDSLTSITIPSSVTSIGDYAFSGCDSLTSISIGNGVTSIGSYAFSGCSSLTSITIPSSVTSIGSYAFSGCDSLTSVTIPDSVTSIGDSAFAYCNNLTSVTIPDSVTSIGNNAFYDCSNLTSVTIPSSVTSIGYKAFYGCDSLTIYCEASSQPSGWDSSWNSSSCPVVWGHTHSYTNGQCICGNKQD